MITIIAYRPTGYDEDYAYEGGGCADSEHFITYHYNSVAAGEELAQLNLYDYKAKREKPDPFEPLEVTILYNGKIANAEQLCYINEGVEELTAELIDEYNDEVIE